MAYLAGLTSANDWPYLLWSGIGGYIIQAAVRVFLTLRVHNCHEPWCWRIGRFPIGDTAWRKCRKHHPDDNPGK